MENTPVYDDVVERLLTLLRETFGDTFHQYYEGDPIEIPKANLPCVIVEKMSGEVSLGATSTDVFSSIVTVRLVLDKLDDLGASDDYDLTERKVRRLIEGRDPITRSYLPNTVLGVIRRKITLGSAVLGNDAAIAYDINPRANGVVTSEGQVTITTSERIIITDRT